MKTNKADSKTKELQADNVASEVVAMLIEERKAKKMTQQDIADATGMKAPNIARIESNKYAPTLPILKRYAEALGKDIKVELVNKKK